MSQRGVIVAVTLATLLLLVPAIQGYSGGVYNQASGCGCHSGSTAPAATVSISGLPTSYDANNLYQVTVSVSGGVAGSSGGFSLEVDKGTLSTGFGIMAVKVNSQGNSATHTITGSSYRSWSFEWTSPPAGGGTDNFEVAAMTTNGNGNNNGDRWVTAELEVRGSKSLIHRVNGESVFELQEIQLDESDPDAQALIKNGSSLPLSEGYLAIQAESHPTQVIKIQIKLLDDP